jgi:hypothetical protein
MRVGIAGEGADQKKLVGLASFYASPTSFLLNQSIGAVRSSIDVFYRSPRDSSCRSSSLYERS